MNNLSAVDAAFAPLAGKRLLDLGCGRGALARRLAEGGADVIGIDPSAEAVRLAREAVPDAKFEAGDACALPFPDGSFDGAVFLNSLHHLPVGGMARGLGEAARVVRKDGRVVVIEPLPEGTFFEAFRPVEDESEVRAAAQAAVAEAVDARILAIVDDVTYTVAEAFGSFEEFVARVTRAAPERRELVRNRRAEIERNFRALADEAPDGRFQFLQPIRAITLGHPSAGEGRNLSTANLGND